MEEAVKNRDFASFAQLTCADTNQFHAVCLDTCPPIFYMNDTSHRWVLIMPTVSYKYYVCDHPAASAAQISYLSSSIA